MIRVAVCGCGGRMGTAVVDTVNEAEDMELVCGIDPYCGEKDYKVYTSLAEALSSEQIDVLVDFTQPSSIYENALYCLNNNIYIVIGVFRD